MNIHIKQLPEPRMATVETFLVGCILIVLGVIIGAYLALQVAVSWTKIDTPPVWTDSSQL